MKACSFFAAHARSHTHFLRALAALSLHPALLLACISRAQPAPLGGTCSIACSGAPSDAGARRAPISLIATLRDSIGEPLANQQVRLQLLQGDASLVQPALSDDAGRAMGAVTLHGQWAEVEATVVGARGATLSCGRLRVSASVDAPGASVCRTAR